MSSFAFRRPTALLALAAAATVLAAPAHAQDAESKLQVHGYLTQAYARSDSLTTIGIPERGTTDYRRAALLVRYMASDRSNLVMQFAQRRLGASPSDRFEQDVRLDWAFYDRKFGDHTSLRVGRAPIPLGLFNETRYAGTVLPFYRAPFAFYQEGVYTAETVDGAVLSHTLFGERAWPIDVSVYGGGFDYLEEGVIDTLPGPPVSFGYAIRKAKANSVAGAQLWFNTPVDGVRVGGGIMRSTNSGGLLRGLGSPAQETSVAWHASAEAKRQRAELRAEGRVIEYQALRYTGAYVQGGVKVVGGLSLHAQYEYGEVKLAPIPSFFYPGRRVDYDRNVGVGASYAFLPSLVLKVEGHSGRGYNYEEAVDYYSGAPIRGKYLITSLSTSF